MGIRSVVASGVIALGLTAGCGHSEGDGAASGGQDLSAPAASAAQTLSVVKSWVGHNPGETLVGGKNLWGQPAVQAAMRTAMGNGFFTQALDVEDGPSTDVIQDTGNPNQVYAHVCKAHDCPQNLSMLVDLASNTVRVCLDTDTTHAMFSAGKSTPLPQSSQLFGGEPAFFGCDIDDKDPIALYRPMPEQIGQCIDNIVEEVAPRLSDDKNFENGVSIMFGNGAFQISFDRVQAVIDSQESDPVSICLTQLPKGCPPGDDRGKVYKTTNKRTGQSWEMANDTHTCGGA
jgi:hypothetical protein